MSKRPHAYLLKEITALGTLPKGIQKKFGGKGYPTSNRESMQLATAPAP